MTSINKSKNIKCDLSRAKEAKIVAEMLFEKKFFTDAVSKFYYFLLYHVRALLFTKGLEPKSHEGALRLFSLHFVKEGIFCPEAAHIFARLMKYRQEADYNTAYVFTEEDVTGLRREVVNLAEEIQVFLKKTGTGFTLLELTVVVIIIGILVTLGIVNFSGVKEQTLNKDAKATLKLIQAGEKMYRLESGSYVACVNTTLINNGLRLTIPEANANWNYTTNSTGCAQAVRTADDLRQWRILITENDTVSGNCT